MCLAALAVVEATPNVVMAFYGVVDSMGRYLATMRNMKAAAVAGSTLRAA